jgi:single-strand DNA-binding protein
MLKIQFIGYIGSDATVRTKDNQVAVTFSVGVNKTWRNRQNEPQKKTVWIGCTIWRDLDKDNISKYLKSGTQIYIEGEPSARAYNDKEGIACGMLDCRVTNYEMTGKADPANAV